VTRAVPVVSAPAWSTARRESDGITG
jgi:hypothetical protein